jgi:NAD-specific glutamate dehydrogenase
MYQASTEQYRRTVAAVVTAARQRKSGRGMDTKRFLEAYYANVDANDMAARAPAMLAGAALSHLKFAQRRRGRALVRVFNPTLKEHGYTSPHTVIEMVNDDMPFLVDSIGLAVSQRSLTIHFLAHPIFSAARDAAGLLRSIEERSPETDRQRRLESSTLPCCNPCAPTSSAACATCASHLPIGRKCARRRDAPPTISTYCTHVSMRAT